MSNKITVAIAAPLIEKISAEYITEPHRHILIQVYISSCGLSRKYIFIKIYPRGDSVIRICLDKTLDKYKISRYELAKRTGVQYQIIDNYYKNKVRRYDSFVLERICIALDCNISEIIEFVKE